MTAWITEAVLHNSVTKIPLIISGNIMSNLSRKAAAKINFQVVFGSFRWFWQLKPNGLIQSLTFVGFPPSSIWSHWFQPVMILLCDQWWRQMDLRGPTARGGAVASCWHACTNSYCCLWERSVTEGRLLTGWGMLTLLGREERRGRREDGDHSWEGGTLG